MKDAMKKLLIKIGSWAVVKILLNTPFGQLVINEAVSSIESNGTLVGTIARVTGKLVPGTKDDEIIDELTVQPLKQWLYLRGGKIILPSGQSLLSFYSTLKEKVTGRP